jgi:sterol desaturase/sphingolipid hydroxylase (fatty acid hydroxylase superfamily)
MSMIADAVASLNIVAKFSHVWWLYALSLSSTGAGAFLCYLQQRRRGERSIGDFLGFVFPKRVIFHRSARLDLWFLLVRRLTFPFIVAPFTLSSAIFAAWVAGELTLAFGPPMPMEPSFTAAAALTLSLLLGTDFGYFVCHYLQHRIPLLWEFHKVHHAAPVLIPPTVRRLHPIDDISRGLFITLSSGLIGSIFLYLYPTGGVAEVTVAGMDAYFISELLVCHHLRHSHLSLRFGDILESIFISPAMHQLHHSTDPRHYGKNFGFLFAFWDRLLGTLIRSDSKTTYEFGLSGDEHLAYDSVWAFYSLPFIGLFRRYFARWGHLRPGI